MADAGDAICLQMHPDASANPLESSAPQVADFSTVLSGVASALREAHERALAPIIAENAQLKRENEYMHSCLGISGQEPSVCQGSPLIREVQEMPDVPKWRPSLVLTVPASNNMNSNNDECESQGGASELASEPGDAAGGQKKEESALAACPSALPTGADKCFAAGADQCRVEHKTPSAVAREPQSVTGGDPNGASALATAPKKTSVEFAKPELPKAQNRLSTKACESPKNRFSVEPPRMQATKSVEPPRKHNSVLIAPGAEKKLDRLSILSLDIPRMNRDSYSDQIEDSDIITPLDTGKYVLTDSFLLMPGVFSDIDEEDGEGGDADRSTLAPRCSKDMQPSQSSSMQQFIQQEIEDRVKLSLAMNLTVGKLYSIVFHAWAYHADRMKIKLEFKPHPFWDTEEGDREHKASLVDHLSMHKSTSMISKRIHEHKPNYISNDQSCAPNCVLFPNSPVRMAWDLFGAFLLGFDVIMIPLSAFTSDRSWITVFLDWFALIFWTGDIFASCRTGFASKGHTVMNGRLILIHYFRTWFMLDLIVVVPDWIFTVAELAGDSGTSSGGSGSKLLRALRVVRMSRVLRLVKLNRVMAVIRDRIDSEFLFIIVNIIKLILLLLVVNHFLASIWYAIGELGASVGADNWIHEHHFQGQPLGERYTVSMHWTLTQFTPASMDVQPQNTGERSFAITVLVCGLVLFSSFISSITNSMTQLRSMDDDRSKQFWLLRRYLRHYKIQANLAFRILRHVEFSCNEHREIIPENKIWVLQMLSDQLRSELTFSVSYSCMSTHPLFDCITEVSRMTMVQLSQKALSIQNLAGTDVLFLPGTIQPQMHYVEAGKVAYLHVDGAINGEGERILPDEAEWICESALWTQWVTLGEAHAVTESKVVSIDSQHFGQVIAKDFLSLCLGSKYAKGYVAWLSTIPRGSLTDVFVNDQPWNIVNDVIEEIERHGTTHRYNGSKHIKARKKSQRNFPSIVSMKSQVSLHTSKSTVSTTSIKGTTTSRMSKVGSTTGSVVQRISRLPLVGKMLSSKPGGRRSKRTTFLNIVSNDS